MINPEQVNKRKHKRYPVNKTAMVNLGLDLQDYTIIDISMGGIAVISPKEMRPGSSFGVYIPGEDQELVCKVCYCDMQEIGDLEYTYRIGCEWDEYTRTEMITSLMAALGVER